MSAPKEQSETPNRRARTAPKPAASVNMEELRELIALLRDNGLAELELENEGFRVRLRRDSVAGPSYVGDVPQHAPAPPPAAGPTHPGTHASTEASQDQDLHIIPSPIVGTFYRSPSPSADAFVKIGSNVEPETVVCIIEAMKLMNEIQAEASGEVVKIYVENGQPVEYGQPLFGIRS
jgi:acetyl-CoA carboxylase biotin carboxyl carrier protein